MANVQRIVPCLWFDEQAEEAAKFYVSIFRNSRIKEISRYSEAGQDVHGHKPGSVMVVSFDLDGQPFTVLNGGPQFKFSEAISLQVMCDNQREVDHYWEELIAGGGEERPCGWLKDKYGLSWQVVPKVLPELLKDEKSPRAQRAMKAMLNMKKLDIDGLKRAYEG
jgi:predicted 3-demethylubiquinone-9 3-methyltransferase (glyoxalase superfamily)